MKKVTIKFEGDEQAIDQFMVWLCESGEQQYWDWMEIRESRRDGEFTITSFDYDWKNRRIEGDVDRLSEDIESLDDLIGSACPKCGKGTITDQSGFSTNANSNGGLLQCSDCGHAIVREK